MDDLREVIARALDCADDGPFTGNVFDHFADAALAAIKQAGFVVVPAIPDAPMINAGAEEMQHHPAPTPIYLAMIEASNA